MNDLTGMSGEEFVNEFSQIMERRLPGLNPEQLLELTIQTGQATAKAALENHELDLDHRRIPIIGPCFGS